MPAIAENIKFVTIATQISVAMFMSLFYIYVIPPIKIDKRIPFTIYTAISLFYNHFRLD